MKIENAFIFKKENASHSEINNFVLILKDIILDRTILIHRQNNLFLSGYKCLFIILHQTCLLIYSF